MNSMNPQLECDRVTHVYPNGVIALKATSLSIHVGEVIGVVGQNGSGKTTLVKHFNGLLRPTNGRLLIDGQDIRKTPMHELARSVGYVFQNPSHQLFASTVDQELRFGPKNIGMAPAEIDERVAQTAEFFGIAELLDKHPYRLAFPLRKLVAMASIYAMNPATFILDEPTTGQDHGGSIKVARLIERLRQQNKTVIIVSHDMALIAQIADRVIAMWSAEVIASVTPRELFANEGIMQRTKLQRPQITQLAHALRLDRSGSLPMTVGEVADRLAGPQV